MKRFFQKLTKEAEKRSKPSKIKEEYSIHTDTTAWEDDATNPLEATPAAFVYVGEGTLVSPSGKGGKNRYFCTVQYRDLGTTPDDVMELIQLAAMEEGDACVGFHIMKKVSDGRYLEAALLYDGNKVHRTRLGAIHTPTTLRAAGAVLSWESDRRGELWAGTGRPLEHIASVAASMGWDEWAAYRKLSKY